MRALEHDPALDVRAVLDAVLVLHEAPDPHGLVAELPRTIGLLIPYDSIDAIGDLALPGVPQRLGRPEHRLPIRTSGAGRMLLGVVLGRRRPFDRREVALAGVLGPHLGAAVDHAHLRAAHREVAARPTLPALTARERQVLALVADGSRDRDIAEALHIEPRTVEKHVEHIRAKLGARSRAEAVARWARATV